MWWIVPSSGVGVAVYAAMAQLNEPLMVRVMWGVVAACTVFLVGQTR